MITFSPFALGVQTVKKHVNMFYYSIKLRGGYGMSGCPLGVLFAGERHVIYELLNAMAVNMYD